jgi:hypothetical protein
MDPVTTGVLINILTDRISKLISETIDRTPKVVEETKEKDEGIQKLAIAQMELLTKYYQIGLYQSERSFALGTTAAVVGIILFSIAALFYLSIRLQNITYIASLAGAISSIISGIGFYLYNKSTLQLLDFQKKLYEMQNYLIANEICQTIENSDKVRTRAMIIKKMIGSDVGVEWYEKTEVKNGHDKLDKGNSPSQEDYNNPVDKI